MDDLIGNLQCEAILKFILRHAVEFMSVPSDNVELLKAQYHAFSRQLPMMYFILISSTWALAATHMAYAPWWLSGGVPTIFSIICGLRVLYWWRSRNVEPNRETALATLRRTNRLAYAIAMSFTLWSFMLYPYGNAYTQSHVAFYMAITVISCIFCLMHLRSAAISVTAIVIGSFIAFFITTGQPTFIAISINIALVSAGMLAILSVNYRNFAQMVNAQSKAEALSAENLRLANIDSLTGLPSRRAFFLHLEQALERARSQSMRLAIGIIDLDGFKPVNDVYGHSTGDKLLVAVGARLSLLEAEKETSFFRLGGDEFAFVIADAGDDASVVAHGEAVCRLLQTVFNLPEAPIFISGCVGMSVYPETATTLEDLFDRADYALYQGKRNRRGSATLFSNDLDAKIHKEGRIEQALKQADLDRELAVAFQPIVDIRSGRPIGLEALARWTNPLLGPVSAAEFIPIAERAGIIATLTGRLLKKSLDAARKWPEDVRLSFNLSAHDLNSAEGTLAVLGIVQNSGFDPRRIDFEITETAFAYDFAQVRKSIDMLHRMGCGISLDDFGTGYSSLTRLHALPLTKIKIDRSFVTDIQDNPASYKIVKSLLTLSRDMYLDCVVEGVETADELATLRDLGANLVQGYFFSPPVAERDLAAYFGTVLKNPLKARA